MKKIMMVFGIVCLMTKSVFGATMCVKNDTISIILDPYIAGTNRTYDKDSWTWGTQFPYGRIWGISACLSSSKGKSIGGYVAGLTNKNPDTGVTEPVVGGENYGSYCWCKMTHPVASLWVYNTSYSNCASLCALNCGFNARDKADMRAGLFGSVDPL